MADLKVISKKYNDEDVLVVENFEEEVNKVSPTVNANPTLAGTEAELTGLEVGNTKYKISGSTKLYKHSILFSNFRGTESGDEVIPNCNLGFSWISNKQNKKFNDLSDTEIVAEVVSNFLSGENDTFNKCITYNDVPYAGTNGNGRSIYDWDVFILKKSGTYSMKLLSMYITNCTFNSTPAPTESVIAL